MMFALSGIAIPSASSTQRTEASACTPVHTPQMRSTKAHASRGSRPLRITSRPRHIVPVDTALVMVPLASTLASMRRCPSMRVMGSTTIRLPPLSSLNPWVSMTPMLFLLAAGGFTLLGGAPDRGHRGMRRDRGADDSGGDQSHLVGVGLHPECVDVGDAVV